MKFVRETTLTNITKDEFYEAPRYTAYVRQNNSGKYVVYLKITPELFNVTMLNLDGTNVILSDKSYKDMVEKGWFIEAPDFVKDNYNSGALPKDRVNWFHKGE